MKAKNEVVTIEKTDNLPMAATDNRGFEEPIDQGDLMIPRAKLLQPMSEELKDPTTTLRQGQIINSLTKEVLPAIFTPIFHYKEYMRFNPRKKEDPGWDEKFAPGALIWKTRDANDPRTKECEFGPDGESPIAITTLNFFCTFEGQPMPIILSFSKSSYKTGRLLLSLTKFRGGAMFRGKYALTVTPGKSDKGNYFVLNVAAKGDCNPDEFKMAESYHTMYGSKRDSIETHIED